MVTVETKFEHLRERIKTKSFQENKGLSNEVGYYLFDYPPERELYVRDQISDIAHQSTIATIGADVHVFNLFDIMLGVVDQLGYRDAFYELEETDGMDQVIDQMNNILEMNEEHNRIVQAIQDQLTDEPTILFITGIGQVYPAIRAHKVLNTMTQVIDQIPVMMFYPGNYNSVRLQAFGELQENNYYRAFHFE
ncbi:DUF1788 domain-containing protein [Schleiferilactobacillus shenzhenensis]|uniref:DUF1788 domain-containing protein n=1 Tax=Schleiferilactobacillus shenzhenensis LY-73 TaxID=1231336 RepID=U4TLL6_9LACO|nr:DUF1788 domain-containing protein [Schleiferilactobacillus shenzhenensis]ERL65761.1 hypothetical protein L248_1837 [Schleiferilactobacillus shenzhenensis LY-73]